MCVCVILRKRRSKSEATWMHILIFLTNIGQGGVGYGTIRGGSVHRLKHKLKGI